MADLDVLNRGVHLLTSSLIYNINEKGNYIIRTMVVYFVQTFHLFFFNKHSVSYFYTSGS